MTPQDAQRFEDAVRDTRDEGRYRVFVDITRGRLRLPDGSTCEIVVGSSNA
jgi:hypothetical protein